MLTIPFFGDYYNIILPVFIGVFCFVFALLSIFKMQNRAWKMVQRWNMESEESQRVKMRNQKPRSLLEFILKGERVWLKEFSKEKGKMERAKLLGGPERE